MNLLIVFNHFNPEVVSCIMNVTPQEVSKFKKENRGSDLQFDIFRNVTPGIYVLSNNDEDCILWTWDEFLDLEWDEDENGNIEKAANDAIGWSAVDGDSSDQYFKIEVTNNDIKVLNKGEGDLYIFGNFAEYMTFFNEAEDAEDPWYPDEDE